MVAAVFLFLASLPFSASAQDYLTERDVSGKVEKWYAEARQHLNAAQYGEALEKLEKALQKEPTFIDARLMYADLQLQRKRYSEAEAAFEEAAALSADYAPLAFFLLAQAEFEQQKYEEAAAHADAYLTSGKVSARWQPDAEQLRANALFSMTAVKKPVPFGPQRLGEGVNTGRPEYLPSLSADGSFLVYTTRVQPNNEDIFISRRRDSIWQQGRPVDALNTAANESSPSISANGKAMVFTRGSRNGNFDLYFSRRQDGGWTEPQRLPSPINTGAWESQPSLSADGRELYFVSDRAGGEGRLDLWVIRQQPDGQWGAPENLGPTINTPLNEQAPFIHPDGHTLYFMSKGHPGMGQYDLFLSRRQPDGSWGTPQNLGYPINSPNNEGALIVSLDGQTAYFDTDRLGPTSAREEMGNADLFRFELYPAARPLPVTYVKAIVREAGTRRPLVATVDFLKLPSGQRHAQSQTDEDGEFLVVLPMGEDYALSVSRPGYLFHSENFSLSEPGSLTQPFLLEIELSPIPKPLAEAPTTQPVILKNVFFETASATLRPESTAELNRLKSLLEDNPGLKIRINGHTDNVGSVEDNQLLSENRAKAVYDYLIAQGIAADRLQYKGFGESQPIATNETAEGRQQNRRTEFEVARE